MQVRSEHLAALAVLVLITLGAGCSTADIDPDGGVDSGAGRDSSIDSGAGDAGDAGMDSAVRDAGSLDTGAPVDSGRPDSAVADTGTVDAAVYGTGEVVITEIMMDSDAAGDADGEWVELHNPSATPFDLNGCSLTDRGGNTVVISGALIVAPGGYIALAVSAMPGFTPDYVYGEGYRLSNDAPFYDQVTLRCRGALIDEVVYGAPGVWSWANGRSMSLAPAHVSVADNDLPTSWCFGVDEYNYVDASNIDYGTPGMPNPPCP